MAVRVGVIGVGYLGRHHARIYSELKEAELAAVSDFDGSRAEEIGSKYGCRYFSDYSEMLGICDAVSIVTPTITHRDIALACLKAGKDILVEKPITQNIIEAKEIIKEAEQKNLILQVGHLERYNPAVSAASKMTTAPRFIEAERLSPFLGRGTDVDITLDLMIHDIDIIFSLVRSRLTRIKASGESLMTDRIDLARAWLDFENGCGALMTASRISPEKQRGLRIFQDDSYIAVDYQNQVVARYFKSGKELLSDVMSSEKKEPLKEELKDFIDCVITRKRPLVSGTEAMNALDTALKITELIKGNRRN
jgi:predicted dehydrogenase